MKTKFQQNVYLLEFKGTLDSVVYSMKTQNKTIPIVPRALKSAMLIRPPLFSYCESFLHFSSPELVYRKIIKMLAIADERQPAKSPLFVYYFFIYLSSPFFCLLYRISITFSSMDAARFIFSINDVNGYYTYLSTYSWY